MLKLIAMLSVKNGILFVEQWLANIGTLVDEIVVVDNGSTDGTYEILANHPKVTALERTEGFDEGRDKILAHQLARSRQADWILWLDVDEIFEDRMTRHILNQMMSSDNITKYAFRRFNFHQDYDHFEAAFDKLWTIAAPDRILWKDHPSAYFHDYKIHNGLINNVRGKMKVSDIRIKHYGAVDRDYLKRKTDIYLNVDPARTDMYVRHRDQSVPVWRWYEYRENPFVVTAQNLLLSSLYRIQWSKGMVKAVYAKLYRLISGDTR